MKPEILHSQDFINDTIKLIENEARAAISSRGRFVLALSGGNTPRPVYEALAKTDQQWDRWIFTFGDERCVPPDDEQSNYRMAKLALFDHAAIPPDNVLRIPAEIDPSEGAQKYEQLLHGYAQHDEIFRHDLLLLGMGDDGHTASLFPGTEALKVTDRWVVANFVPKFDTYRITMTYPLLDAARHVCFLVNSKGKDAILEEIFSGKSSYPSAAIRPTDGKLTWLLGA